MRALMQEARQGSDAALQVMKTTRDASASLVVSQEWQAGEPCAHLAGAGHPCRVRKAKGRLSLVPGSSAPAGR